MTGGGTGSEAGADTGDVGPRLDRPAWRASAHLLGGLTAWALQFTAVYGAVAVACGRGAGAGRLLGLPVDVLLILVATGLALAVTLALMVRETGRLIEGRSEGPATRFADATALALNGFALVAILFTAAPALILSGCR